MFDHLPPHGRDEFTRATLTRRQRGLLGWAVGKVRDFADLEPILRQLIAESPNLPGAGGAGKQFRLVKITGATAVPGASNRWAYTCVDASSRPEGTMVAVAGAEPFVAYNPGESFNDGSGVEGNGVDQTNLPSGWGMQPIGTPTGAFVAAEVLCNDQGEEIGSQWWIVTTLNHVDGPCG